MKYLRWLILLIPLCLTLSITLPTQRQISAQTTYQVFLPSIGRSQQAIRGVGLTYGHCEDVTGAGANWEYVWSPNPPDCQGIENVPMIWGAGVPDSVTGNSSHLLGGNECDLDNQCNVSPQDYVAIWHLIEERFPNRKLVAPVPSHLHPEWIVQFRDAYIAQHQQPPRLDALAVHCYLWTAQECITLTNQYIGWANQWGIQDIWVTEFAFFTGNVRSMDATLAEANAYIVWMRSQPIVSHFAWFAARIDESEWWANSPGYNSPLFTIDGIRTPFGTNYASH